MYQCEKDLQEFLVSNIEKGRHTFIVGGLAGCGKTHTVKQVAKDLGFTFISVDSNVADVKEVVHSDISDDTMNYLICIENVDTGVSGVQQSLLKSIEEYAPNLYWVITCRNIKYVQETILSRGTAYSMSVPTKTDIDNFAQTKGETTLNAVQSTAMWKAVRSFADVNFVTFLYNQDKSKFDYFNNLVNVNYQDTVSNLSYKIQHYPDKSKIPLDFLFKFLIANAPNSTIQYVAIQHLKDLERLNSYVVVNHFLFTVKYCL